MEIPGGMTVPEGQKGSVLRLKRALEGLKQCGRAWYHEASEKPAALDFTRIQSEWSLFTNSTKSIIIGLYVDDLVVTGQDLRAIHDLRDALNSVYKIKDCGEIGICIGVQVVRNRQEKSLQLSQFSYIQELLSKYGVTECNSPTFPISDYNGLLAATPGTNRTDIAAYHSLIGELN
jgi:hypothetical protein